MRYKNIIILIVITIFTLSSCNNSPLIQNKTYFFYDSDSGLNCYECDPNWRIMFKDNSTGLMWTERSNSNLKSCQSTIKYNFDENSQTISIIEIDSRSSQSCQRKFIGNWRFVEGKFGKRFYSDRNKSWDFSTY